MSRAHHALPAWAADPASWFLTEAEYEALPSEVRKSIEVVDGRVMFCESPSPGHQRVSRNVTMALMAARPPGHRLDVLQSTDMHFRSRSTRFTFRRPAVSLLRCLDPGSKLSSERVLTAVEITPSDSEVIFNDKRAEYAAQGIPVYLIVVMDGDGVHSIDEHRLDMSGRNYGLAAVHRHSLVTALAEGVKLDVTFEELERI